MCTPDAARGFSLIELIVMVVVLAVGIAGILSVYTASIKGSADPLVRKQALAIAEAMLDEIQLNAFDPIAGAGACGGSRADNNDVSDYHCPAPAAIVDINGAAIAGLGGYNVAVTVANTSGAADRLGPGGSLVPDANAKLITVTVTSPAGDALAVSGYKVKYP